MLTIEMDVSPLQRGKMLPDLLWNRNILMSQSDCRPQVA